MLTPIIKETNVAFYDNLGQITIYAKQYDTERCIKFNFLDEEDQYVNLPVDDPNFIGIWRQKAPNGTIFPHILTREELDPEFVIVKLSAQMLSITGIAQCELVLGYTNGLIQLTPEGMIENEEDIHILTSHTFALYIQPTATGETVPLSQKSEIVELTDKVIAAQATIHEAENIGKEWADKAKEWAVGPSDTSKDRGTDDYNAKYFAEQAEWTIDQHEIVHLGFNDEGHLIMYKSGKADNVTFRIDNNKDLIAVITGLEAV